MSPRSRDRKSSKTARPVRRAPGSQMREPGLREAILDRLARTLDQSGGPDGSVTDGYVAALERLS